MRVVVVDVVVVLYDGITCTTCVHPSARVLVQFYAFGFGSTCALAAAFISGAAAATPVDDIPDTRLAADGTELVLPALFAGRGGGGGGEATGGMVRATVVCLGAETAFDGCDCGGDAAISDAIAIARCADCHACSAAIQAACASAGDTPAPAGTPPPPLSLGTPPPAS